MSEASEPRPAKSAWLERLALHRPEMRAWALYDWANSAFYTVVITAVFPVFFANVASSGSSADESRRRFALTTTIAMAVAALLGPILGAVADYARLKKTLFAVFFGIGVLANGAMFWIGRGDWLLAAVLFGIANIGIASSFVFYDAFLPHIAREDEADRLSTTAYAIGYLGGGLCLALCIALIRWQTQLGLSSDDGLSARAGFVVVALWWFVFTIPFLRRVPEPPAAIEADEQRGLNPVRVAFTRIGETLRELRRYKHALLLLLAFLAYSDGIGTIIRMAAVYATSLHVPDDVIIVCILLVQFIGIPFAILFGRLAALIGAKRAILVALAGYVGICIWGALVTQTWQFVAMAVMVAMVQGGAQALSRSLFASLIPRHKSGEFFGLFSTLEKFAGVIGPLVFAIAPSNRTAVLLVAVLFVVGAVLLTFVDVEAGRSAAREADATTRAQ